MIDLKPAAERFLAVLAAVTDDQLACPTPCPEYTVGDLVDHVDQVARGATALAHQDTAGVRQAGAGPEALHRQTDWRDRVAASVRALGHAWDDPEVWRRPAAVPGSDLPNEVWGRIALTELVVHGWDIARATSQAYDLPDATLQACLDHVASFVPNAPVPGLWGPAVEVGPAASVLDRIVAITGRIP